MSKNIETNFDAIVIGSGISGGWAAKELTGKGLKTLVIERGRDVQHIKDYPTTNQNPWEFEHRNELTEEIKQANPIISKCYAFREDAMHFFVKDAEHPYIQEKPFDWVRGYQLGGKSLTWARQTQRWSDYDFEGPKRDGFAVDWPIRYNDLEKWYSYVEKFIGVSGNKDNIPQLPDGDFLPPMELTKVEKMLQQKIASNYQDRQMIIGRCAHISEPKDIHLEQGRSSCQYRNLCQRGCPFGGYFSSNASTLPWAARTGKLTIVTDSVAHSIIYDEKQQKATGVKVINAKTKAETIYNAPIIFINAGALNTNLLLLNSKSKRFPNGLGNDNGLLGKYLAFHNYRGSVTAEYDGELEYTIEGRRPTSGYMPRFRNVFKQDADFLRGYAVGLGASPSEQSSKNWGADLKNDILNPKPGPWKVKSHIMGETIPKETNKVWLDDQQKDEWGIPKLRIDISYDENDEKMLADYFIQVTEMFSKAGFTNIKTKDSKQAPGLDIHEMGGVRMGKNPQTSLLNEWNQLHLCKNVFVTDGACMTSTSTQNPSLTYMALTARACDYAASQFKNNQL